MLAAGLLALELGLMAVRSWLKLDKTGRVEVDLGFIASVRKTLAPLDRLRASAAAAGNHPGTAAYGLNACGTIDLSSSRLIPNSLQRSSMICCFILRPCASAFLLLIVLAFFTTSRHLFRYSARS